MTNTNASINRAPQRSPDVILALLPMSTTWLVEGNQHGRVAPPAAHRHASQSVASPADNRSTAAQRCNRAAFIALLDLLPYSYGNVQRSLLCHGWIQQRLMPTVMPNCPRKSARAGIASLQWSPFPHYIFQHPKRRSCRCPSLLKMQHCKASYIHRLCLQSSQVPPSCILQS